MNQFFILKNQCNKIYIVRRKTTFAEKLTGYYFMHNVCALILFTYIHSDQFLENTFFS